MARRVDSIYTELFFIEGRPFRWHREALVTPKEPVNQRRTKNESKNRSGVVHVVPSDWQIWREWEPDDDEDEKADRVEVDSQSPLSKGEGSPSRFIPADLVDEERSHDLEIRHVEGEVVEREDGVYGGCGGDVDQHEQEYDGQDQAKRIQGDAEGGVPMACQRKLFQTSATNE